MEFIKKIIPVKIAGAGYVAETSTNFNLVSQLEFLSMLSPETLEKICAPKGQESLGRAPTKQELFQRAQRTVEQVGFNVRPFFKGTTAELAALAAINCLEYCDVNAAELDLIIGATNTGPGYPSLADHVKLALSETTSWIGGESEAGCSDEVEACTSGAKAMLTGAAYIRSGMAKKVLVVTAEKAELLPCDFNDYFSSNLFGSGGAAVLLVAGDPETDDDEIIGHTIISDPMKGKKDWIKKLTKEEGGGFWQNGKEVHKFVGKKVPDTVHELVAKHNLLNDISHLFCHQPSHKTVYLLKDTISMKWPEFKGTFHIDVSTGNISSASAIRLFAKTWQEDRIRPKQKYAIVTFGAGLSISIILLKKGKN